MDKGVFAFESVKIKQDFIDSIFSYDVGTLESTDSIEISQFTIALSQYLIYIKSQINNTKADILAKEHFIDNTVFQLLTDEILKKYKTKKDASSHIISSTEDLYNKQQLVVDMKKELMLIDGIDKSVSEYIAAFKREMTRRENEQWQTRKER